jgi:hypothetical protein
VRLTQVSGDDFRIPHHIGRLSLGDLLSVVENHHPVRHAHQGRQDVLDHDDRNSPLIANQADELCHLQCFGRIDSGDHFVKEQYFRSSGERAGKLEAFAAGEGQADRQLPRPLSQTYERKLLMSPSPWIESRRGRPEHRGDGDIFQHGEIGKRPDDLMRANQARRHHPIGAERADAALAQMHLSRARGHGARDDAEEGGFAGAVRADDAENLSLSQLEADPVDCFEASKVLRDGVHAQQGHVAPRCGLSRRLRRKISPEMPRGSKRMISTSKSPLSPR